MYWEGGGGDTVCAYTHVCVCSCAYIALITCINTGQRSVAITHEVGESYADASLASADKKQNISFYQGRHMFNGEGEAVARPSRRKGLTLFTQG